MKIHGAVVVSWHIREYSYLLGIPIRLLPAIRRQHLNADRFNLIISTDINTAQLCFLESPAIAPFKKCRRSLFCKAFNPHIHKDGVCVNTIHVYGLLTNAHYDSKFPIRRHHGASPANQIIQLTAFQALKPSRIDFSLLSSFLLLVWSNCTLTKIFPIVSAVLGISRTSR